MKWNGTKKCEVGASSCSTAVEHASHNPVVMGLVPAMSWAFYLLYISSAGVALLIYHLQDVSSTTKQLLPAKF